MLQWYYRLEQYKICILIWNHNCLGLLHYSVMLALLLPKGLLPLPLFHMILWFILSKFQNKWSNLSLHSYYTPSYDRRSRCLHVLYYHAHRYLRGVFNHEAGAILHPMAPLTIANPISPTMYIKSIDNWWFSFQTAHQLKLLSPIGEFIVQWPSATWSIQEQMNN